MANKTKQLKLEEQPDFYLLTIDNGTHTVKAPLPDEVGITVGSEYASPFDTSELSQRLSQAFAIGGMAKKVGIKMKRYYVNPELTEISFELQFVAYYSTAEEVIFPIYKLMTMGVGRDAKWQTIEDAFKVVLDKMSAAGRSIINAVGYEQEFDQLVESEAEASVDTSKWNSNDGFLEESIDRGMGLIGLVTSPFPVTIRIGNTLLIENAFVSSVNPRFSNILDPRGFPMSATVSVTCVLREAPTSGDGSRGGNIENWFSAGK